MLLLLTGPSQTLAESSARFVVLSVHFYVASFASGGKVALGRRLSCCPCTAGSDGGLHSRSSRTLGSASCRGPGLTASYAPTLPHGKIDAGTWIAGCMPYHCTIILHHHSTRRCQGVLHQPMSARTLSYRQNCRCCRVVPMLSFLQLDISRRVFHNHGA